ncbi:HK97-gp10 family putative phage morphogenesis protein [Sphingomonas abaci]|uniref:HK97 gp10 family phage protein n=1 Tax=Sphingomonas abaci TaxID=237611 RepID=A0A7W7EXD1_9SPHN|nr:HK97 gp10 family phage protein [Sphingomonas abaci]
MPKITGGKAHAARLKFMVSAEAQRQVGAALFAGGDLVKDEAQGSITRGSAGGQKGGKHQHVRSLPGQPPNEEFGGLRRDIENVQLELLRVEVSSNAPYAAALEFGTSKMAERPYMRPAVAATRDAVTELVRRAVAHIAKGGKVTG